MSAANGLSLSPVDAWARTTSSAAAEPAEDPFDDAAGSASPAGLVARDENGGMESRKRPFSFLARHLGLPRIDPVANDRIFLRHASVR